jgi:hypothetical protein
MVTSPQVRQVMPGIGVSEASSLWVQERVDAGDEHIGWDAGRQRLVDPPEYLARRVRRPGDGAQHAAGRGHNHSCRHTLARGVIYYEAKLAAFQLEKVIGQLTPLSFPFTLRLEETPHQSQILFR